MMLFKGLRRKLHRYVLKRKLKKHPVPHRTSGYTDADSIIILFDASQPEHVQPVKNFFQKLRSEDKHVRLFAYLNQERKGTTSLPFPYMTRKNISWLFIPKHPLASEIMESRVDILISLCTEECLPLEYMAALSRATFRVGRYEADKSDCYDLMIETGTTKDIQHLIAQIDHYLRIIRPRQHEPAGV
ncbi:MAG: hypothetical protein KatS3mg031_1567 [Chitinophagales bacterium]|nr:MAG: hypothetical protein KatS3mg031_1567 [Chitinophagales bacterium]